MEKDSVRKPKYQIGDIVSLNNNNYLIEDIIYWFNSEVCSYHLRRLEDNYTCIRYHVQVDSRFEKVV